LFHTIGARSALRPEPAQDSVVRIMSRENHSDATVAAIRIGA
jgi:hypothetical protein